jgi:hypothetical protein
MEPLPDSDAERRRFLTTLYDDLSSWTSSNVQKRIGLDKAELIAAACTDASRGFTHSPPREPWTQMPQLQRVRGVP